MSVLKNKNQEGLPTVKIWRLPFALPVVQGKNLKKNCCRKFRKGKRCKRCPGGN